MHYYIASHIAWLVAECDSQKQARRIGIEEPGRGEIVELRPATGHELEAYQAQSGLDAGGEPCHP